MLKEGGEWKVKAAGPTTSSREEPYEHHVIREYGVRAVIGKGGMGAKTLAALEECGAVYLNGIGDAAQYYARSFEKVLGVHLMEFGIPEAMWHLRAKDFVAIVTMDAHGNSLHADVERETGEKLAAAFAPACAITPECRPLDTIEPSSIFRKENAGWFSPLRDLPQLLD